MVAPVSREERKMLKKLCYTLEEFCELTCTPVELAKELIKRGEIPAAVIDGKVMIPKRFVRRSRKNM